MGRSVLVTGGAGYVGSHVCKALSRAGYHPISYDNLERGHRWAVKWGPLEEHDINDGAAVRRAMRKYSVEAVIHCAGYAYVGESFEAPDKYFRNNVCGSLSLLEAVLGCGVRHFILSSTCAVYGALKSVPVDEDHASQAINPYGETKFIIERALRWYGETHPLNWASLRYFNAAGADPDGEIGAAHDPETRLIPSAIQALLGRRGPLEIYGSDYPTPDGTAVRDYVHVTDLADAHVQALDYLMQGGQSAAFNLGTGHGRSVREVIGQLEQAVGRSVPVRHISRRPGDPAVLVADAKRAKERLGWRAMHSDLATIIDTAWRWHAPLFGAMIDRRAEQSQ